MLNELGMTATLKLSNGLIVGPAYNSRAILFFFRFSNVHFQDSRTLFPLGAKYQCCGRFEIQRHSYLQAHKIPRIAPTTGASKSKS